MKTLVILFIICFILLFICVALEDYLKEKPIKPLFEMVEYFDCVATSALFFCILYCIFC